MGEAKRATLSSLDVILMQQIRRSILPMAPQLTRSTHPSENSRRQRPRVGAQRGGEDSRDAGSGPDAATLISRDLAEVKAFRADKATS